MTKMNAAAKGLLVGVLIDSIWFIRSVWRSEQEAKTNLITRGVSVLDDVEITMKAIDQIPD